MSACCAYPTPVRQREPHSGEQARRPQHEVRPAASTQLQPAVQGDHVAAKATSLAQEPKRAGGRGSVGGAARGKDRRGAREPCLCSPSGAERARTSPSRSRAVRSGSARGLSSRAVWPALPRRRPCGPRRLKGRDFAVDKLMERAGTGRHGSRGEAAARPASTGCRSKASSSALAGTVWRRWAKCCERASMARRSCGAPTYPRQTGPNSLRLKSEECRVMLRADNPPVSRERTIRLHDLKRGLGPETGVRAA